MSKDINSIIILGSARKNGNTLAAVKTIINKADLPIIEQQNYLISRIFLKQ